MAPDQLQVVEAQNRKSMAQSVREDDFEEGRTPTAEQLATLRKVAVPMPYTAYLICFLEFAGVCNLYIYYLITQV